MLWNRIKIIAGVVALVSLVSASWYVRSLISDRAELRDDLAEANARADRNAKAAEDWKEQAGKVDGLRVYVENQDAANRRYYDGVYGVISKKLAESSAEMRNCLSLVLPDDILDGMRQATRRANGENPDG